MEYLLLKINVKKYIAGHDAIINYAKKVGYKVMNRFWFVATNTVDNDDEVEGCMHGTEFVGNIEIPFYVKLEFKDDEIDIPCMCTISNTRKEIYIKKREFLEE